MHIWICVCVCVHCICPHMVMCVYVCIYVIMSPYSPSLLCPSIPRTPSSPPSLFPLKYSPLKTCTQTV